MGGAPTKKPAAPVAPTKKANSKAKSPAPAPKSKLFTGDDGRPLPWIDDEKFKRVRNACYYFQYGTCTKTAEECMRDNNKKHDRLSKDLLQYCRMPGKAAAKKRAASASAYHKSNPKSSSKSPAPQPKTRWDTPYCWDFADGKCQLAEADCPRKPHLTEGQAKAAAKGKARAKPKGKSRGRSPAGAARAAGDISSALAAAEALDIDISDAIAP